VLGIDPGLDRTGYAVVETPTGRLLDAGLVRSTVTATLSERLAEIDAGLQEVLAEHAPGLMIVEDLFAHYKHPRTAILMGHARGVILAAAARRGIEVLSVSATRIKKVLTGNGHASKTQVQNAVTATLGVTLPPDSADVADALAAAFYAIATSRDDERAQTGVVSSRPDTPGPAGRRASRRPARRASAVCSGK
jgi:crossover junction endodeoxyribonuclease RuvC